MRPPGRGCVSAGPRVSLLPGPARNDFSMPPSGACVPVGIARCCTVLRRPITIGAPRHQITTFTLRVHLIRQAPQAAGARHPGAPAVAGRRPGESAPPAHPEADAIHSCVNLCRSCRASLPKVPASWQIPGSLTPELGGVTSVPVDLSTPGGQAGSGGRSRWPDRRPVNKRRDRSTTAVGLSRGHRRNVGDAIS